MFIILSNGLVRVNKYGTYITYAEYLELTTNV